MKRSTTGRLALLALLLGGLSAFVAFRPASTKSTPGFGPDVRGGGASPSGLYPDARAGGGAAERRSWSGFLESWRSTAHADRASMIDAFVRDSGASGLESLFAWLAEVPDEDAIQLQREILARVAAREPTLASRLIDALPEGARRNELGLEHALGWAERDLAAAVKWIDGWPAGTAREVAAAEMGALLADGDPAQLGGLVGLIGTSACAESVIDAFYARAGAKVFPAALEIALQLPHGEAKERALIHLSREWSRRDLDGARRYAENAPPGAEGFVIAFANHWSDRTPQDSLEWAASGSNEALRPKVVSSVAARWATWDPPAAADYVAANLAAGELRDQAMISVISAWAAHDPIPAGRWIGKLPAGDLRTYALDNVAFQWAAHEPEKFAGWLDGLSLGGDRDTAIAAGGSRLIDHDPDLAVEWFRLIRTQELRDTQTERAVRRWLEVDPAGARAWADRSDLPVYLRRKLGLPSGPG